MRQEVGVIKVFIDSSVQRSAACGQCVEREDMLAHVVGLQADAGRVPIRTRERSHACLRLEVVGPFDVTTFHERSLPFATQTSSIA